MVTWLRKTFIKNYQDIGNVEVRSAHGVLSALVGLVLNLILFSLKTASALYMASQNAWIFSMALLGDSLNNLFDFSSSLITLIGFRISRKPADAEHPYGHQRAEYIAGMLIGVAILSSCILLAYHSITNLISGARVTYDLLAYIALGATLPVKALQSYTNYRIGAILGSDTLKAVAVDSLLDAILSSVLLIFAFVSPYIPWNGVDGVLGILVALFLSYNGIHAVKDGIDSLLGSPIQKEMEDTIRTIALSHPEVEDVHDILCHSYGEESRFISFHITLDGAMSLSKAHSIVDSIEREVAQLLRASVVVHPDPKEKDEELDAYVSKAKEILSSISPECSLHDAHFINDAGTRALAFDVLIPFNAEPRLKEEIEKGLASLQVPLHIEFDHPYHED